MSFQDIIKNSILETMENNTLSTASICITLGIAILFCIYIYAVYYLSQKKSFYNKQFNIVLGVLPIITAGIILAMQSNLVISLGMVGALSIVRYRTAIKDPMDLLYLFWSISVGITSGAGMYVLVVAASLIMLILIHILYHRQKRGMIYIMVVHYQGELTGDEVLRALKKLRYQLKSKTFRGDLTEMTLEVYCRSDNTVFLENIKAIEQVKDVTLIQYNGEYHG